ncbi:metastasis-associated in colon cancer protein 1 [Eucyclogobius newberryi]|uniref:metastasis-associated in colon cancer protein 1 n=1 Tax=Eucyclogobius newberryi TaxID=166745 RepID=UPI003B599322
MADRRIQSIRRVGSLMRSRSEGTLIDLDDDIFTNSTNGATDTNFAWPPLRAGIPKSLETKNPFWNKLSGSNPFLDDIVFSSPDKDIPNPINAKQDSDQHANNDDAASTSSDEGNIENHLENKVSGRSGRCRSASDILDDLERKGPKRVNSVTKPPGTVLNPDFEWLKDDREAYKMAWLSHRQLTRSCLDLNLMSQSPGWAQTQATDFQVISKIGHTGGSVQLPDSDISIHFPKDHVAAGEVQEVTLKATLDPPPGLNNNYMTTMSPLVEVILSNINTKKCIALDVKLSGAVRADNTSQLITVTALLSNKREGPYVKMDDCYIDKNMMQMKLQELKTHFYVIAVAEACAIEPPASSVWDYLDRSVTVALYGPRYIHPSFKVVIVVCCHDDVPPKLPFSDVCRGNKNLPPLVLQLWGKHQLKPDKLNDMKIAISVTEAMFKIQSDDKQKEIRKSQLKIGTVLHLPVALSCARTAEIVPFTLALHVTESNAETVAQFQVTSPTAAPLRAEKRSRQFEKRLEMMPTSPTIPEESVPDLPSFQDNPVNLQWYGVALKSVLRQPRVDYLLEYFKGDTMALLSKDTVKSVGNFKVKEWYIGFLRGRIGLVHCKNVKLITKDQVMDFTGIQMTTEVLLDNMTLPFRKLTYMYSAIQTLVTEHISSWRNFASSLGYHNLTLDTITRRYTEAEADKVASVLEKLKEDCHTDKSRRKFLHELMVGLLKMDAVNLAAQLMQNTVILSTAVELGSRWRELAEKMGKLTSAQIVAYEAPHRGKNGEVSPQATWKPAYDFLYSWSQRYKNSFRDMIQDLHLFLDKMKNPTTRQWRQLTGALITVNCLQLFRNSVFPKT